MAANEVTQIKYVYLDVVKFTVGRSVEAQTDIISALNEIVKGAVAKELPNSSVIYVPIGDGICIALLADALHYDSHIRLALEILRRIYVYNQGAAKMRQFQVRIGINQNDDNVTIDINENRNVVGAGVNYAQRIMSFADGNQILVSRSVYDSLTHREKYMRSFRPYKARVKHNVPLELFQYVGPGIAALNREVPSEFAVHEQRLSKVAAYYFAHCIKNRKFLLERRGSGQNNYALALLLWYLAVDSVGESESTEVDPYEEHMPETKSHTLSEQFELFMELPFWVCCDLSRLACELDIIPKHYKYFEDSYRCTIVNVEGQRKLKSDWPEIWREFDLDSFAIQS